MTTGLEEGARHHAEGRLAEAEAAYRSALNAPPSIAVTAHQLLAMLLADQGQHLSALEHYDAARALGAGSPELHFRRGRLLRRLGRLQDALLAYDALLGSEPNLAEAHHLKGVVLAELGDGPAAVESYDRAIALDPTVKTYWNNRGVALEAEGRLEAALSSYAAALDLDPDYAQAHHNRGSALIKQGLWAEAVQSFDRALALDPRRAEPWSFRAVALASQDQFVEALKSAESALSLRPSYPEAHNTRSIALRAIGRYADALEAADAALRLRPGFIEALNSRGSALLRLGRFCEAAQVYEEGLSLRPEDAALLLNLGMALEMTGDLERAKGVLWRAADRAPGTPDAPFANALVHIRDGDLRTGFRLYEQRWLQKGGPRRFYPDETLWLGETPLDARTLLVHAEQGFGDVIQFCRFATMAAPPEQLIIQVQAPLKRLMFPLGVRRTLAVGEEPGPFDVHIPIMSLPLALNLALDDVTPKGPYLRAAPALVRLWRERLPPPAGLRIGLAWSGNPGHDNDHNRSMALEVLAPILALGHQCVSLQRVHHPRDEVALSRADHLLRVEGWLADFAETAALIETCDVVVSVDTAVAHLAGALGKPLFLLLPWFCDWRWMSARSDSPWYPSAVLLRQPRFGDWPAVAAEAAAHVAALAQTRTTQPS